MKDRDETLTDEIATIVQTGHRDYKTSHQIAQDIVVYLESIKVLPVIGT